MFLQLTPYMTGADVANVCSTAGRIAARSGSNIVSLDHFSAAVDRVQHGLEKPDKVMLTFALVALSSSRVIMSQL